MKQEIRVIKLCPSCRNEASLFLENRTDRIFKFQTGKIMCLNCGLQTPEFII